MGYSGSSITGCNSPNTGSGKTTYTSEFDVTLEKIDLHDHTPGKGTLIPTAGLEDDAVTAAKIADNAVGTAQLQASAVTTAKIADTAVTLGKLDAGVLPAGLMMDYAGGTVPTGWLDCDGSSLNTTTYAALFAAIGYTFGGSGTSFNIPDARGRATIGVGTGSGLTARALGATLGEETHVLTAGESGLPAHTHTGTTGGQSASHTHQVAEQSGNSGSNVTSTWMARGIVSDAFGVVNTGAASADHNHSFTTASTGGSSGSAHNNMQPSIAVKKIIKT